MQRRRENLYPRRLERACAMDGEAVIRSSPRQSTLSREIYRFTQDPVISGSISRPSRSSADGTVHGHVDDHVPHQLVVIDCGWVPTAAACVSRFSKVSFHDRRVPCAGCYDRFGPRPMARSVLSKQSTSRGAGQGSCGGDVNPTRSRPRRPRSRDQPSCGPGADRQARLRFFLFGRRCCQEIRDAARQDQV